MKLIGIFNFSIVSKRFYCISRSYKFFCWGMGISKHMFCFNVEYERFMSEELQKLNSQKHVFFKDLIKKNKFVFNIVRQILKALAFFTQRLLSCIFFVGVVVKLLVNVNFAHVFLLRIWLSVMLLRTILPFTFAIFNRRLLKT